jgi:hypothetical protein
LGNRIDTGPSRLIACRASRASSSSDDGASTVIVGIRRHRREVEDAVVARAVVARDAGPVEHEHDVLVVQPDVEVGLVERPREERRVDGDDRDRPAWASPAAEVTMCCSAMPTSITGRATTPTAGAGRSSRAWRRSSRRPRGYRLRDGEHGSENAWVHDRGLAAVGPARRHVERRGVVQLLLAVGLGGV